MSEKRIFLGVNNIGVRTADIMLTIDQARHLTDNEPDVTDLLREYSEVELFYREAVAAMSTSAEPPHAPVSNSSGVNISFESVSTIAFDSSHKR